MLRQRVLNSNAFLAFADAARVFHWHYIAPGKPIRRWQLDAITHQQSTFTRRDMARFAHRHCDGIEQFKRGDRRNGPGHDRIELGKDAGGGRSRREVRITVERGARPSPVATV